MKILLTGASGRLGPVAAALFLAEGHEVLATDIARLEDSPVPIEMADLCDAVACQRLTEGMDAVVHLGNISHSRRAPSFQGYQKNTTCNFNVFQAAVDNGVRKILFASSIQVYGIDSVSPPEVTHLPSYLPVDDAMPVLPHNWYALSKVTGESALEYFARETPGLEAVAIRFPALMGSKRNPRSYLIRDGRTNVWRALMLSEAARLLEACLRAPLPGYRWYLPVHPGEQLGVTPQRVIAENFPHVPLKLPLEQITTLIDVSRITQDTGWVPQDLDGLLPPE